MGERRAMGVGERGRKRRARGTGKCCRTGRRGGSGAQTERCASGRGRAGGSRRRRDGERRHAGGVWYSACDRQEHGYRERGRRGWAARASATGGRAVLPLAGPVADLGGTSAPRCAHWNGATPSSSEEAQVRVSTARSRSEKAAAKRTVGEGGSDRPTTRSGHPSHRHDGAGLHPCPASATRARHEYKRHGTLSLWPGDRHRQGPRAVRDRHRSREHDSPMPPTGQHRDQVDPRQSSAHISGKPGLARHTTGGPLDTSRPSTALANPSRAPKARAHIRVAQNTNSRNALWLHRRRQSPSSHPHLVKAARWKKTGKD